MNTGIIAIVIIVIMLVLYIIDKFPIPLVTVSGMIAMIFANIISYNDAFNSFVGSSVVRIFGMIIIINALMESGVITWVKKFFVQMTDKGEKIFLIILFLAIGIFSTFANNSALVAIFMPFVASISRTGKIKNKNLFMLIGMGSIIGGTGTLVGCTSITLASEALANNGAKELGFFTTAPITLIVLTVVAVCYYLFLYKLQNKWFDFEEKDMNMNEENTSIDKRKAIIALIVFFTSVICFAIKPFGWNNGLIAVALVVILMLTKCVEPRKELFNMNWEMLIVLGATIAIADGFTKSGAGTIIIDSLVSTFGVGIM